MIAHFKNWTTIRSYSIGYNVSIPHRHDITLYRFKLYFSIRVYVSIPHRHDITVVKYNLTFISLLSFNSS